MPSQYEILRPIEAFGETLLPGSVVDVSLWRPRNVQALIANGRLRELTLAPAPDGLKWTLVPVGTMTPGKPGKER